MDLIGLLVYAILECHLSGHHLHLWYQTIIDYVHIHCVYTADVITVH